MVCDAHSAMTMHEQHHASLVALDARFGDVTDSDCVTLRLTRAHAAPAAR